MTKIKVMLGKDIQISVQILVYAIFSLLRKWKIPKVNFKVKSAISLLLIRMAKQNLVDWNRQQRVPMIYQSYANLTNVMMPSSKMSLL